MISKLKDIFLRNDRVVFSTDNSCASNKSKGEDIFESNRSYFVDGSTGLGFRFSPNAFTYSKGHRRIQFALIFLFGVFYPLIAFRSLYSNVGYSRLDILKTLLFYVPLSLGAMFISFFGIFCPLRAVTLMHKLEISLLGKNYLFCMSPLDFENNDIFFSEKSAKIAMLRQQIIAFLILLTSLCAIRFVFLHSHIWYKLAIGIAAHNIIIIAAGFIFSVAILSLCLSLVGTIQSYDFSEYEAAKCKEAIGEYIIIYGILLSLVFLFVVLMGNGAIILSPILFVNVVSFSGIIAAAMIHYSHFKEQLYCLVNFLFFGKYLHFDDRNSYERDTDNALKEGNNRPVDVDNRIFSRFNIFDIIERIATDEEPTRTPNFDSISLERAIELIKALSSDKVRLKKNGRTSLMEAANHDVELARALLTKGVNINARDSEGYSALMHACTFNNTALLNFLLEKGAYISASDIGVLKESKNIFNVSSSDKRLEEVYSSRVNSFAALEKEATSWWSYFLFSLTGRGKFVELIARYKYEIQGRDDKSLFENINLTPGMARLIAKIRKCDVEDEKCSLKEKLKYQYIKANNAIAAQQIRDNHYEQLLSLYDSYKMLLTVENSSNEITAIETKINTLYRLLGINKSLCFIKPSCRSVLGENASRLKKDQASFDNLVTSAVRPFIISANDDLENIRKMRDENHKVFRMAMLEHKLLGSYFSFGSAKLCDMYADYYGLPKQVFTVTFMRALAKRHIKNRSENAIYDLIADDVIISGVKNDASREKYSHCSLLPDHFEDDDMLQLALTHYKNKINRRELFRKARGYALDTHVNSIFYWLNFTNIDEHKAMLRLLDEGKFEQIFNKVELEVLEEVINNDLNVYYDAVNKAQNRFKVGQMLLSTAREDDSIVYRLFARSKYYLGCYFIKVNILYLPYGVLLALKADIKKNVQYCYSSYRFYFNFRGHNDLDQDIISSFIRDTAIDIAEFFIDLVCMPIFACCSLFLGLYRAYQLWVPPLKVPDSKFKMLSWALTIVVSILRILLDVAYFPIFIILYPILCSYDYFHIAYIDLSDTYDEVISIATPSSQFSATNPQVTPKRDVCSPTWLSDDGDTRVEL